MLVQPAAANLADAYAQIGAAREGDRHATAGREGWSAKSRAQSQSIVGSLPKPRRRLTVYHELEPDYYSATSKTFIGRSTRCSACANIADAADKTGSGYPQLSAEYIVAADPDLIVLVGHELLRPDRGEGDRRGRAGARSRP